MTRQPLGDLFHVEYGNKLDMNKMTPTDPRTGIAFVGRVGGLNGKSGVSGYVEALPDLTPYPTGLITVALGGSRLLSSYVQQRPVLYSSERGSPSSKARHHESQRASLLRDVYSQERLSL